MISNLTLFARLPGLLLLCLLLGTCADSSSHLDKILEQGEITVVTRNGPTSYYFGKDEETGLDYELAKRFAEKLGVKLKIIVAYNTADIIDIVARGEADFAAAGLKNIPGSNSRYLMFGPSYQWVTMQLVYRNGQDQPTSLNDIYPDRLDLANGTIKSLRLESLRDNYPDLAWNLHVDKDNHELLEKLENGEISYTVADSNEVAYARQHFPEIRAAFNLSNPQPLAWATRKSRDQSLVNAIAEFYDETSTSGELAELMDHFTGPTRFFDYVDSRKFVDRLDRRLTKLKPLFEDAATAHDLDWRLLAAISYQESHWNVKARSPTGVRGLMMLTLATAKSIGIENRLDPKQSIDGGAKYFKGLLERIPDHIQGPDRTWFAIAAYNVGLGHVEDARIITEKEGGDPDKWEDVRERLPLLSQKKWYKKSKYGYARGKEPVKFVDNIKKYYTVLVQLTQPEISLAARHRPRPQQRGLFL